MMIFYYNPDKSEHERVIKCMFASYKGNKRLMKTKEFFRNEEANKDATVIVFAGMIRGEGLIYRWCRENNKPFLFIDHAYLKRGYNVDFDNQWMRITQSGFVWNKMEERSPSRWKTYFRNDYPLHPWQGNRGKNILILPPSSATRFLFPDCDDWMLKTMAKIRSKLGKHPIIVREKPDQVMIDDRTNAITSRMKHVHPVSIEKEIEEARLIVTYSSAVPVLGTIMGVPCITSENCAAYPMSADIDDLRIFPEPNRKEWLYQLVHHQYRVEELKSGEFWNMLEEGPDEIS